MELLDKLFIIGINVLAVRRKIKLHNSLSSFRVLDCRHTTKGLGLVVTFCAPRDVMNVTKGVDIQNV